MSLASERAWSPAWLWRGRKGPGFSSARAKALFSLRGTGRACGYRGHRRGWCWPRALFRPTENREESADSSAEERALVMRERDWILFLRRPSSGGRGREGRRFRPEGSQPRPDRVFEVRVDPPGRSVRPKPAEEESVAGKKEEPSPWKLTLPGAMSRRVDDRSRGADFRRIAVLEEPVGRRRFLGPQKKAQLRLLRPVSRIGAVGPVDPERQVELFLHLPVRADVVEMAVGVEHQRGFELELGDRGEDSLRSAPGSMTAQSRVSPQ